MIGTQTWLDHVALLHSTARVDRYALTNRAQPDIRFTVCYMTSLESLREGRPRAAPPTFG